MYDLSIMLGLQWLILKNMLPTGMCLSTYYQLSCTMCQEQVKLLTFTYVVDAFAHNIPMQWLEPELGTPRGQRLNDAGHVVTYEDKASDIGVSLHGAPQCILRVLHST